MDKKGRLFKITELIQNNHIPNQERLQNMLLMEGIQVTQATLSRDLRSLNVYKVAHEDLGYVYSLPKVSEAKENEKTDLLANAFKGITFSGNTAVIKTLPAFANSIALTIDQSDRDEIIGSLAGDDTIILILNEKIKDRQEVKDALIEIMPGISGKI